MGKRGAGTGDACCRIGSIMRLFTRFGGALICVAVAGVAAAQPAKIEISFTKEARAEPVTGMVYVAISRDNQRPPIQQAGPTGVPLFSHYVEALAPGAAISITGDDRGHPIRSLRDLPAGDYWMQPFVNVYTRFNRA